MLQLNHNVPANCTAQASQSRSRGAHTKNRRAVVVGATATASTASRYCRNAAAVKNSDPTKNVREVVRGPVASA